jgi:nucleoside-diphosphate-sugar epimerase
LIGSHLLNLLPDTWSAVCLGRNARPERPVRNVQWNALDLSQAWEVTPGEDSLPARADAVIHLAQSEHFREFPERAAEIFRVNTVSTLRLLDYARQSGARTFVLASSGGIYGYGEQEFSEDIEIPRRNGLGFYLGTKLCSEIIAESYTPFLNVIVLRFFFVYGVGQRRTMLIPRLVQSVIDGRPIVLDGQDGLRINPTHVSNAAAAIMAALDLDGSHKINVGGPEVLSLRQIGETIGEAVGKPPTFEEHPEREPRHLVGDIRKMSQLLAPPTVRFSDGIAAYVRETYP